VPYQSDFLKGERATFCRVEVARHGELDFGAGLSKKDGFSFKNRSDRAQVHLFAVLLCFKILNYFSLVAGLLPFL